MQEPEKDVSPVSDVRLSRRRLMLGGAGLVAAGALAPLLAACGGSEAPDADGGAGGSGATQPAGSDATSTADGGAASPTTGASEGEPVSGGTLILGYGEPEIMDPRISGAAKANNLMINLFDTLIDMDRETGELRPFLATSWEADPNGKIYTFKLRDDVKFHDGTPFDAEAIKYTFDSIVDPATKSLTAIGNLGPYDDTEIIDPYTARVVFKDSYAPFLTMVAGTTLAPVSPTAAKELGPDAFGRQPVGTGPFMFKEWKEKISMTFVRNPDYAWAGGVSKNKGPAYLDEIVVKFIPEATTLSGSLGSGETTIIDGVLAQEVEKYQNDPNFQILLPSVAGSPQILPLNAAKFPTDDINVRKAIIHAVDTPAICQTLWFGTVRPADAPLASTTWAYNEAVQGMYPYDPDKSAELLEAAGWTKGPSGIWEKDGQQLELEYITSTGIDGRAGELVQAYLMDVGIKVNLQQLEYAATATLFLAGAHHIARIGYTGTDPIVLSTLYHSRNIAGTNFNRTMKPDDKLDEMLDAAASEMDREKRRELYLEIQQYIMDQALFIPLWEQTVFWGASAKVKGLYPRPVGQINFHDTWLEQ